MSKAAAALTATPLARRRKACASSGERQAQHRTPRVTDWEGAGRMTLRR